MAPLRPISDYSMEEIWEMAANPHLSRLRGITVRAMKKEIKRLRKEAVALQHRIEVLKVELAEARERGEPEARLRMIEGELRRLAGL